MGRIPVAGLLVLVLGLVLPACSVVTIQQPAGEPVSDAVGNQVEGWWVAHGEREDESQCFFVQYLKEGAIRVATLEWDSTSHRIVVKEYPSILTQLAGTIYLNVSSEGESNPAEPRRYFLLRVHWIDDRAIVLWWPRVSAFAEAVTNGELRGENIKEEARITASKPDLETFLKSHSSMQLFMSEEPKVFMRP